MTTRSIHTQQSPQIVALANKFDSSESRLYSFHVDRESEESWVEFYFPLKTSHKLLNNLAYGEVKSKFFLAWSATALLLFGVGAVGVAAFNTAVQTALGFPLASYIFASLAILGLIGLIPVILVAYFTEVRC